MVYLEDGRKELYQWDTGISVASTEACDVMEITRETYPLTRDADATLVGTMYRADVPDELLTEAGYLKIALVTVAGESRRTNAVYRMRINPRAKPKYVFTDHRVDATTQEILMRISALEEKIKNGTIEGAVLYTKPQALKEEEKKTARENIDAVSSKNADGTERDFVYTTDTASIGQKAAPRSRLLFPATVLYRGQTMGDCQIPTRLTSKDRMGHKVHLAQKA